MSSPLIDWIKGGHCIASSQAKIQMDVHVGQRSHTPCEKYDKHRISLMQFILEKKCTIG